jgi:nitrogen fixation/metabolism regulation signal transduction histidine kinase
VADTSADVEEVVRQIRQQSNFDEVLIAGSDGAVKVWIGAAPDGSTSRNRLLPDKPSLAEVQDAITKGPQKFTETLGERAIFSRVVILIPAAPSTQAARVLQIMLSAPREVIIDAQSVESGVRDYQRLQLLRDGLKRVFALTLTLAMVLTLFSAIALSFLLSERLSAPLSALAESTRAIARGDFTKLNPVKSRDEFGVLTQSFNTMTRQLSEASSVVAKKQLELEAANVYLESILGNLTSGVVTLDERLRANSVNRIARDMLGISAAVMESTPLPQWAHKHENLAPMIAEIAELLAVARETPRERPWERQFMIETQDFKNTNPNTTVQLKAVGTPTKRALLVRGTKLPQDIDAGYVLVIDDITGLIQAQRDAAWGEVARRLAHEIKNPLTPIQLSAERMQMKLADKLPEHEREILGRATHTIVAQVAALKRMVDDFSLYSRASRMKPESVDLNELVLDVLALYQSMPAALVSDLAPNLPRITADPALLRQVIHNLMQNAQDALTGVEKPTVTVSTRGDETSVSFCVADNGSGIGADVMARIFEPYITTKPRGTGLGLPIVKKIIEEHRGTILAENTSPQGAMITIHLPIATATGEIG